MTYESGGVVIEETYTANEVTAEGERNGINPPTPVDKIKLLEDGADLTIKFWASLAETPDQRDSVLFGVRHYTIQALPGVLPHPFINGTTDTGPNVTVDPLGIEHNTTVTARYAGMSGRDKITLEWFFADGTHHSVTLDGLDGGEVVFNLTADKVLHRSVNSTVCLKYSVVRDGAGDPIPSQVQTVRVNTIPAASLPQPRINNIASGGTLDVNNFAGNATAAVPKWSLSHPGQRVWLICSSAGVTPLTVLNGVAITATEALNGLANKAVLRSWLKRITNGRQITITCEVTFDGSNDKLKAVIFRSAQYIKTDPWTDAGHYFNTGNLGGWTLGRGGLGATFGVLGLFVDTPHPSNAGAVISRTFNFNRVHRYSISYYIGSVSPPGGVPPITAVLVGSQVAIPKFTVPNSGYIEGQQNLSFIPAANGPASVVLHNYQDLGGGSGSQGGNDFHVYYIGVYRLD